ncbi:MAG: hypothetical protein Q4B03_08825 [Lachnospiraceae bacterium]|nr:hypothetical protein [Lachnospiraceae bacterium]
MDYYIASCVFTSQFPNLSRRIQNYISDRYQMEVVRCCTPKYKLKEFTERMPEDYQCDWSALADTAHWKPGDTAWSLCHNCSNIVEETAEKVEARSLWELILQDHTFAYPDFQGRTMSVQDCWRSRHRRTEQDAVRELLKRMNITAIEVEKNFEKTDFCGNSLLRPQPPRNPVLAPKYYKENIEGLFLPHTEEEQTERMKEYCRQYETREVICYCHYCLEGLKTGGVQGYHIAELLFSEE